MARINAATVELLLKRDELKAQLKELESKLKPKIQAACDGLEEATVVRAGGHSVKLHCIKASSIAWRTLAHEIADEQVILEALPRHTEDRFTFKAEVID